MLPFTLQIADTIYRVTTSISERHPPFPDTPSRDRRPVSSPLAVLVCSAEPRRSRIKRLVFGNFTTSVSLACNMYLSMEHSEDENEDSKKTRYQFIGFSDNCDVGIAVIINFHATRRRDGQTRQDALGDRKVVEI